MKRYITADDIIETYCKFRQRGLRFILSKFLPQAKLRTLSAFNTSAQTTSNWWDIPLVVARWNQMVSGDKNTNFQTYYYTKYLEQIPDLKILSLGSGDCWLELDLAKHPNIKQITCVDIAYNALNQAKEVAREKGYTNIEFLCEDLYRYEFAQDYYDLVIFNSSLHHFKDIDSLFSVKVKPCLKSGGMLLLNEYVGPDKIQLPKSQLKSINQAIGMIPKKFRLRKGTTLYKNSYSGPGLIRMYLADPSESVESSTIIPAVRKHFDIIEEKSIGGNILMAVLKDIGEPFIALDAEKEQVLNKLFAFEDAFLESNSPDYIIGLYRKK